MYSLVISRPQNGVDQICITHSKYRQFFTIAEIAQLGERQTEDLKVPGSKLESSHEL